MNLEGTPPGTYAAFAGTHTALVTPFLEEDGQPVDWDAFDRLVDAQVDGGVSGIVPCGTTGESPTLNHGEHLGVIKRAVARARGRVKVIGGSGSNSTREAVALSREAERAGVDAVMVVVPYYNKPTQEGLQRHFVEVASAVACPVVIYNIPARTGIDLLPETLARICEKAANVLAVKEATGNVLRAQKLVELLGSRITILSGDDALTLPMIAVGARGVISVTSNLLPAEVSRATRLALEGNLEEARRAHLALVPVHEAMFLEANPGPVKAALAAEGRMKGGVRGPLVAASAATLDAVGATLKRYRDQAARG
jgi:4-hydroxy-tetrahydrodipicolinate synthase